MLRVAFASNDRQRVNQHFGAAEAFVVYDIAPSGAALVAVGDFPPEAMDGNEGKLAAKVDFLKGCAAVYVLAIGASAIRLLMAAGVQPMRINENDAIPDLLQEIRQAMQEGGVAWIDRALASQSASKKDANRFDTMADESWEG